MGRSWGIWTREKLHILADYLPAFTRASKRAPARVYLDLFAGQAENYDRATREPLLGSVQIALQVDGPPFTKLRFFEREGNARRLTAALERDHASRDARVYAGDCNATIRDALRELKPVDRAPTFAFIDPNGPHCHWQTLVQLAQHRPRPFTKVELWMLFPTSLFIRTLQINGEPVSQHSSEQITRMYGTDTWSGIYRARCIGLLEPEDAREEYVNLMRWRLQNVLGYTYTHVFEIFNEAGRSLYHMIFATDHQRGTEIMQSVYRKAAREIHAKRAVTRDEMKREKERAAGILALFDEKQMAGLARPDPSRSYEHVPPWRPRWGG